MEAIDLTKILKPYTSGWVAINKKNNQVVAHAKSFKTISSKIGNKPDIVLIPASKKYFGFVTQTHG